MKDKFTIQDLQESIFEQMENHKKGLIEYKDLLSTVKAAQTIMTAELMKIQVAQISGTKPIMLLPNKMIPPTEKN